MRFTAAGLMFVGMAVAVAANAPSVTPRVIEREVYYSRPTGTCEIPRAVVRLAKAVQFPAGIEQLPEDCDLRREPRTSDSALDREKVYLTGMTVGEALDDLVAADPRYRWVESDGVVVIRPVNGWGNPRHFLNRTLDSFSVVEEHMGGALHAWRRAMWGNESASDLMKYAQRTTEGNRIFSVAVDTPAAIEALDHIVRAHGALYWQVTYCQPAPESRHATVFLWTLEDDPTGIGVPLKERFSSISGKTLDACKGKI